MAWWEASLNTSAVLFALLALLLLLCPWLCLRWRRRAGNGGPASRRGSGELGSGNSRSLARSGPGTLSRWGGHEKSGSGAKYSRIRQDIEDGYSPEGGSRSSSRTSSKARRAAKSGSSWRSGSCSGQYEESSSEEDDDDDDASSNHSGEDSEESSDNASGDETCCLGSDEVSRFRRSFHGPVAFVTANDVQMLIAATLIVVPFYIDVGLDATSLITFCRHRQYLYASCTFFFATIMSPLVGTFVIESEPDGGDEEVVVTQSLEEDRKEQLSKPKQLFLSMLQVLPAYCMVKLFLAWRKREKKEVWDQVAYEESCQVHRRMKMWVNLLQRGALAEAGAEASSNLCVQLYATVHNDLETSEKTWLYLSILMSSIMLAKAFAEIDLKGRVFRRFHDFRVVVGNQTYTKGWFPNWRFICIFIFRWCELSARLGSAVLLQESSKRVHPSLPAFGGFVPMVLGLFVHMLLALIVRPHMWRYGVANTIGFCAPLALPPRMCTCAAPAAVFYPVRLLEVLFTLWAATWWVGGTVRDVNRILMDDMPFAIALGLSIAGLFVGTVCIVIMAMFCNDSGSVPQGIHPHKGTIAPNELVDDLAFWLLAKASAADNNHGYKAHGADCLCPTELAPEAALLWDYGLAVPSKLTGGMTARIPQHMDPAHLGMRLGMVEDDIVQQTDTLLQLSTQMAQVVKRLEQLEERTREDFQDEAADGDSEEHAAHASMVAGLASSIGHHSGRSGAGRFSTAAVPEAVGARRRAIKYSRGSAEGLREAIEAEGMLRELEELVLGGVPSGNTQIFASLDEVTRFVEILEELTHLRKLDLRGCRISQEFAVRLAPGLGCLARLEKLVLAANPGFGTFEGASALAKQALPRLSALRDLDLSTCDLGTEGPREMLQGLRQPSMANLEKLNLQRNANGPALAKMAVRGGAFLHSLRLLDLRDCGGSGVVHAASGHHFHGGREARAPCESELCWATEVNVEVPPEDKRSQMPLLLLAGRLVSFNMSRLDGLDWKMLRSRDGLPKLERLVKLDISHCGLHSARQARQVIRALRKLHTLQELNLAENKGFGTAGLNGGAKALADMLLPELPSLRSLSLWACGLYDVQAACDLAPALGKLKHLEKLVMYRNSGFGTQRGCQALVEDAFPGLGRLRKLNLGNLGINKPETVEMLASSLHLVKDLEELVLVGNIGFGTLEGSRSLVKGLARTPRLRLLDLKYCNFEAATRGLVEEEAPSSCSVDFG